MIVATESDMREALAVTCPTCRAVPREECDVPHGSVHDDRLAAGREYAVLMSFVPKEQP